MPRKTLTLLAQLSLAASLATACTVTLGPTSTDTDSSTSTDPTAGTTGSSTDTAGSDSGSSTTDPSAGPETDTSELTTSGTEGTTGTGTSTTGGASDLPGSCAAFCDNLLTCVDEAEHGYATVDECVTECVNAAGDVATDECDAASIEVNECAAALECAAFADYWAGSGDPVPCASENLGQIVGCDSEEKCAGYCTVGVECLSDQPGFATFDECFNTCVDEYGSLELSCQPPYADLNVCVAGLTCEQALTWWNGEDGFMCADEDDALLMCA
jgi:hypothetical protein